MRPSTRGAAHHGGTRTPTICPTIQRRCSYPAFSALGLHKQVRRFSDRRSTRGRRFQGTKNPQANPRANPHVRAHVPPPGLREVGSTRAVLALQRGQPTSSSNSTQLLGARPASNTTFFILPKDQRFRTCGGQAPGIDIGSALLCAPSKFNHFLREGTKK